MSEVMKSRRCTECEHIFEYALWLSTCPNCRSNKLEIIDGPPPVKEKVEVKFLSNTPVRDPNAPKMEVPLIRNHSLGDYEFTIPLDEIKLVIQEGSF